jgi:hypothetical protein
MLKELGDEGTESGNWKDKTRVSFSVVLHHTDAATVAWRHRGFSSVAVRSSSRVAHGTCG